MKAWKNTEETFAKKLGLIRVRRTDYSSSEPDCYNDYFVLEAKERKQGFPRLIEKAFKQCEGYVDKLFKKDGIKRIPLVGLHKWHTINGYYIVLKLDDFVKLLKEAKYEQKVDDR